MSVTLKEKGIEIRKNTKNTFCVVELHYSADKKHDDEWLKEARKGMPSDAWEQEMEINFTRAGGASVYPDFDRFKHVKDLDVVSDKPIVVGWDFGYHHPAIVICQISGSDQLIVLNELMGTDITIREFAKEHVLPMLKKEFPRHWQNKRHMIEHYGDPAGNQVNDKSEFTSIQLLKREFDLFIRWKRAGIKQGVRTIQNLMMERADGSLGFLIDRRCRLLIEGFEGGYQEETYSNNKAPKETPFSDEYFSHTQDALRYVAINKFPQYGRPFTKQERRIDIFDPFEEPELYTTGKQARITGYE